MPGSGTGHCPCHSITQASQKFWVCPCSLLGKLSNTANKFQNTKTNRTPSKSYIYIGSASFAHWQQHSTTSPFPDCKIMNPRAPIEAERLQQQKGLVSISLVQSRDYLISNMILKIRVDFRAAPLHHDCVSNLRFALLGSQKNMQLCELRLEPILKMQQVLQL